ncbi:MAG: LamG domain-containing protein [Sedimentisphaerales bacterium]|nr:LamG domain-containing protein [Sedimentisphaerales bacterium]
MSKKSCVLISLVLVSGFFNVHSAYGGDVWWSDQSEDLDNHLWNGPNNWAHWDDGIEDVVLGNEPNEWDTVYIGKGVGEKTWPPTLFEYTIDPTPVIDSNVTAVCYALWGPCGSWEGEGWYYYLNILGGSLTIGDMNAPDYSTHWEIAGATGEGDVNVNGGVINVAGDMTIGSWDGLGDVNMTGGEINVKFALCMPGTDSGGGENKDAQGTLKLSGGTIRCGGLYLNEWATFPTWYDWVSEWMSISTREPITGSSYESTIDLSGGTLIIDGDYTEHIASFAADGYMTVYGVDEGEIAPDDRRAYVKADYDLVEDTTTVTAATADLKQAYNPRPAHYSQDQPINVILRWSAGDGATKHDVYLGTSFEDVNNADKNTGGIYCGERVVTSYDPDEYLTILTTYYWRIDEFDGADTWKGRVWCFKVANHRIVDDFDSYSNETALLNVWEDWQENGTGAEVYLQKDQDFEPDGSEMKYKYNNDNISLGSVAEASIDDLGIDKDWTTGGVTKSLVLYFYGEGPDNSATENDKMYVAVEDTIGTVGAVPYDGDADDVKEPEWHEWNIDLQEFDDQEVDLTDVSMLYIGFGGEWGGQTAMGGDGVVYFNDIKLYPPRCFAENVQVDFTGDCIVGMADLELMASDWLLGDSAVTVVCPASAPKLWYRFDEGTGTTIHNDGDLGPGLDGSFLGLNPVWVSPGAPAADACDPNFALSFDGVDDYVSVGYSPELSLNDFTVSAWVNLATEPYISGVLGTRLVDLDYTFDFKVQDDKIHGDIGDGNDWINIAVDIRAGDTGANGQGGDLALNTWYMITYVIDNTNQEVRLYLDGDLKRTIAISGTPLLMQDGQSMRIGHSFDYANEYMDGRIDDVRIYSQALSQEEILHLTGAEGTVFFAVPSPANVTDPEPPLSRHVNFADYAIMSDYWLEEILWP